MSRSILFAFGFAALAAVAWSQAVPIWFLFVVLALYHGYQAWKPNVGTVAISSPVAASVGVIDRYQVDGENEPASLGLFVHLAGSAVFVDIREDHLLEERKRRAVELHETTEALGRSLANFVETHAEYRGRRVASIGLHSEDIGRAEVFWDPTGCTLLRGLEFVED